MSAQITRRVGLIVLGSALLVGGLVLSVPGNSAFAGDCLPAPNSPAPADSHWYYRTDRSQQRQCWYLRAANEPSHPAAVPPAPNAPLTKPSQSGAAAPYSLASFKDFLAQRGGAKLSDQEVEKLYVEFLEWNGPAAMPAEADGAAETVAPPPTNDPAATPAAADGAADTVASSPTNGPAATAAPNGTAETVAPPGDPAARSAVPNGRADTAAPPPTNGPPMMSAPPAAKSPPAKGALNIHL
jgi:hypothetical protein